MALIHQATLTPTKLELLTGWLPGRSWFTSTGPLRQVGAYRFDDPSGEVGTEGFLLGPEDGTVYHVPLTYRGAPLEGAEEFLVGTLEHSVLGRRWVYDAPGDPVWVAAVVTAALTGGTQVEELVETDGHLVPRVPTATVAGSGTPGTPVPPVTGPTVRDAGPVTVITSGDLHLLLVRVAGADVAGRHTLTGRWAGGEAVLAAVV